MTKTLEELDKAIKEKCPHLMELTFGCEVTKSNTHRGVVVGTAYDQIAYLNYGEMKVFLAPEEQFEVLGKEPQLSDVLYAIYSIHPAMKTNFIIEGDGEMFWREWRAGKHENVLNPMRYDLTKSFYNQSPETHEFLYKLICN